MNEPEIADAVSIDPGLLYAINLIPQNGYDMTSPAFAEQRAFRNDLLRSAPGISYIFYSGMAKIVASAPGADTGASHIVVNSALVLPFVDRLEKMIQLFAVEDAKGGVMVPTSGAPWGGRRDIEAMTSSGSLSAEEEMWALTKALIKRSYAALRKVAPYAEGQSALPQREMRQIVDFYNSPVLRSWRPGGIRYNAADAVMRIANGNPKVPYSSQLAFTKQVNNNCQMMPLPIQWHKARTGALAIQSTTQVKEALKKPEAIRINHSLQLALAL